MAIQDINYLGRRGDNQNVLSGPNPFLTAQNDLQTGQILSGVIPMQSAIQQGVKQGQTAVQQAQATPTPQPQIPTAPTTAPGDVMGMVSELNKTTNKAIDLLKVEQKRLDRDSVASDVAPPSADIGSVGAGGAVPKKPGPGQWIKRDGSIGDQQKVQAVSSLIGSGLEDVGTALTDTAQVATSMAASDQANYENRIAMMEHYLDKSSLYGKDSEYPFITMDMIHDIDKDAYMSGYGQTTQGDRAAAVGGSIAKGVGTGIATGAALGAALGAQLGTTIGPWGAVIGGIVGLIGGGIGGGVKARKMKRENEKNKREALRKYQAAVKRRQEKRDMAFKAIGNIRRRKHADKEKGRERYNQQLAQQARDTRRSAHLGAMAGETQKALDRNMSYRAQPRKALSLGRR